MSFPMDQLRPGHPNSPTPAGTLGDPGESARKWPTAQALKSGTQRGRRNAAANHAWDLAPDWAMTTVS